MDEGAELAVFASRLTANDYDVDRQGIELARVFGASGVTVALEAGEITVTGLPAFNGVGGFDYELRDSSGVRAIGHVTVNVGAVPTPPVIAEIGVLEGREDTAFDFALPAVIDEDGGPLLIELRGAGGTARPGWIGFDAETLRITGTPPADFNGEVALELSAADGLFETVQGVTLAIAAVNDLPVITTDGGGAAAEIVLPENRRAVTTVAAADADGDPLRYAVTGGADAALFAIDAATGALAFAMHPNFEAPQDADGDNFYEVTVAAFDGTGQTGQALSVQVEDVADTPSGVTVTGTAAADVITPAQSPEGEPLQTEHGDLVRGLRGADRLDRCWPPPRC